MSDRSVESSRLKWIALIVGMVLAVPLLAISFPLLVVMIAEAPWLLAGFGVMGFVFLAWAGVRTGVLSRGDDVTAEADPLTTLQERYATGELSEAEFERRLERILESDELVREAAAGERVSPVGGPNGPDGVRRQHSGPPREGRDHDRRARVDREEESEGTDDRQRESEGDPVIERE